MSLAFSRTHACVFMALVFTAQFAPAFAQAQRPTRKDAATATADPSEAEDQREKLSAERFLSLLEKNPRRGTALDRVYGYHVERGSLDAFIKGYEDRVAKDPKDGVGWLVLGLLQSQAGRDAAAVGSLQTAEEVRADDPMTSYYLGQALVLVGQPDEAAAAFERALNRKPRRSDLLEIFQALGRVYQRAQKPKEAMEVWTRLEGMFPDDERVREQIAAALAEEGQAAAALPRYEALAKSVRDPFRQAQFAMTAADLKVRVGKLDDALREFESLLGKLRPDSWLYKEVRRKLDDVFLRNDDQAGLAAYYEAWIKKNPEDVEALVRLGRSLAAQGRLAEARTWYEKAIALAPSRRELRLALIGQLAIDQKFADAAAQFEAMDKAEPNNPDTLRDWGGMILRDKARPEAERKAAAAAVWRRLVEARPNDPVTAAQTADLFRQAELTDDALALYRKAIELAPADAQYREYLGEYLHTLKRSDEALAVWGQIAEGKNRDVKNLTRLAEVLSGFGYLKQAIPPLTEAVDQDKTDFTLRLKLADLLHRAERFDDARAQLDSAESLAESDEERSASLEAQVKNDLAASRADERIAALQADLNAGRDATAARWSRLARYLEATSKLPEAVAACDKAIAIDPRYIPAWALAARVRETAGQLGDAADAFRRLAEIDRRNRSEYLTGVAKLEARLGRAEPALKAGRDLIASAPGNPEHYEFFATLCFQLGRDDDALDALRRAVRVNPNETKVILNLADTLAGLFHTEEAVEMYWRAFEKSPDIDGKLGIAARLSDLYLQRNQLDRLFTRLQHELGETQNPQQQRELALCMAQVHASSGDLGSARSELERLLAANARDTQILQQLSKLAEEEGDLENASKYQKQLVDLAPSDDAANRLALLYIRHGELDEAQALWARMASTQSETHKVFQAMDNLLGHHKGSAVIEVAESMIRKDPRDWEAIYRLGVAFVNEKKPDDAARWFQTLLDLRIDDDERSAIVKSRTRDPRLQSSGARTSRFSQVPPSPLENRINAVPQIRALVGLELRSTNYSTTASWPPPDFGQARIAALGWSLSLAPKRGPKVEEELLNTLRAAADRTPKDPRALWDWYFFCVLRNEYSRAHEAALALSRAAPTDPFALWNYLNSLGTRVLQSGASYVRSTGEESDSTPPLPAEELDHMMASLSAIRTRRPDLLQSSVISAVSTELKRAKRTEELERFYHEIVDQAEQSSQITAVISLAGQRGDLDAVVRLIDKLERLRSSSSTNYITGAFVSGGIYFPGTGQSISQAMSVAAGQKAHANALRLVDHVLDLNRKRYEQPTAASRRRTRNTYPSGYAPSYQIWLGRNARYVRFAFPSPNAYLETDGITTLRTAYELFKRDDLLSDLLSHFRKQAEAAPTEGDAVFPLYALSAFEWWEEDRDAAIADFVKVANASKLDSDIRLTLADLYEQAGQSAEALAVIDAFKPLDNSAMQRREEHALRLAVLTGNIDRARQAAERLFGLRLDTDTQVRLAGQMDQLGMHDLADSVLARARRRAGGKAAALVGLMMQYQRQNKTETAVQVALQILRSSTGVRNQNPNVYNANSPDAARTSAIQVLARSGKLQELIDRVEEQIKKAPNAIQLHQSLADYYSASGKRDKAREEFTKIAELRPDDAGLRYQIAKQLAEEGQHAAAVPHYKAAIALQPSVLARDSWEVANCFRQAKKADDLIAILNEIDIRALGQSYVVFNMIQNLSYDQQIRDALMPLFKKAWQAYPSERVDLLSYVRNDDTFWRKPESFEYVLEALIPTSGYSPYGQWNSFGSIISYSGDGRINSVLGRVLDLASSLNRLDDLRSRVSEATTRNPSWLPGSAIVALVSCREGRYDDAREIFKKLLATGKDDPIPMSAWWIMAAEIENYAPLQDVATTLYERSIADTSDNNSFARYNYRYGPLRRLVKIYERAGRKEDARNIIVSAATAPSNDDSYPDDYRNQMRLQGLSSMGQELAGMGYTAEALPILVEALRVSEEISPSGPNYIGNLEQLIKQAQDNLTTAMQGIDPNQSINTVLRLLAPAGVAPKDKPSVTRRAAKDQAVDFVLLIHPSALNKSEVRSLLGEAIPACSKKPEALERIESSLGPLRENHPDDVSVRIAETLATLASDDKTRAAEGLKSLDAFAESHPLEPLPTGARANARQRTEAAHWLPIWLVVRACKDRDVDRAVVDRLRDRAFEAARRQSDHRWTLAMLREQGQNALDTGNEAAANAAWGKMLDLVLARETPRKPPAAGNAPAPPPPAPAPARPAGTIKRTGFQQLEPFPAPPNAAPRPAASNVPIPTLDKYLQAMQIAQLAAEHGQFALSLRAVRESLAGGPPLTVTPRNSNSSRMMVVGAVGGEAGDTTSVRIIDPITELDTLWRNKKAPAEAVYETLANAVIPAARPSEMFLYAEPLTIRDLFHPRSLGVILADWAVRSGKADDLRERINTRRKQTMAQLPAAVLDVQLALASTNAAAAEASFKVLSETLMRNQSRASVDMAAHAAIPALQDPKTLPFAVAILDLAIPIYTTSNSLQPAQTLLTLMARRQIESGDLAGARKHLNDYLDHTDKVSSRYSGTYPIYLRKQALVSVAAEFARAGLVPDTMDALAKYIDAPPYEGGDPPADNAWIPLQRFLARMSDRERYDVLKAWVLPAEKPVTRILTTVTANETPPEAFNSGDLRGPIGASANGLISSSALLIDTARTLGKLDALAEEVATAAEKQRQGAESLRALVAMARKTPDVANTWIASRDKTLRDELKVVQSNAGEPDPTGRVVRNSARQQLIFSWSDYELVHNALATDLPSLRESGEKLADTLIARSRQSHQLNILPRLQSDLAAANARNLGARAILQERDGGLAHWHPATSANTVASAAADSPSWWLAEAGTVLHLAGLFEDFLLFDYPLGGTYEITAGFSSGGWAQGGFIHHGVVFEPDSGQGFGRIFTPGDTDNFTQKWSLIDSSRFNRMSIHVEPGRIRYLVNGHLFHEENDPSPSSPWVGLFTRYERRAAWRNLAIKGDPIIPREVPLSHKDRLDGWIATFYGENIPTRLTLPSTDQYGNNQRVSRRIRVANLAASTPPLNLDNYEWWSSDGVIHGRKGLRPGARRNLAASPEDATNTSSPSYLAYVRPLREGDSITYEFRHEPEQVMVHPTIGRIAFLLEPQGVRLHWLNAPILDPTNLPRNNAVDVPENRRGPKALPLKAGEWNSLKLTMSGSNVLLELNGTEVYQHPLEPGNNRRFGLYHDKEQTSAEVRNVVLRGNWPDRLPDSLRADLTGTKGQERGSLADRRARQDIIGERFLGLEVGEVLNAARTLEPEARYGRLADWVLATPVHPWFRCEGEFTSASASGSVPAGQLQAPAIELVAAAKSAGKLDDLTALVEKAESTDDRGRHALQTLIAVTREDDATAGNTLDLLKKRFASTTPKPPGTEPWPEFLACHQALTRPALRERAIGMLELLQKESRKKEVSRSWQIQVSHLLARADLEGDPGRFGDTPPAPGWTPVTHERAEARGLGYPPQGWSYRDGVFTHHPGYSNDLLYFGVPLRGDFAFEAEVSAGEGREIRICYAGQSHWIRHDLANVNHANYSDSLPRTPVKPPIEAKGDWLKLQFAAKGNRLLLSVNGRQVHEAPLPAHRDPWLALNCDALSTGRARNLEISGAPVVPETLEPSAGNDLAGWLAGEYQESLVGDTAHWIKRGDEIVGNRRDDLPGAKLESVLRYNRPLLEDGELSYDFYYEASESLVHPALGRLAFLLEPDGVRLHRLTNAQYEQSGLTPDNAEPCPDNRRGPASLPLKNKAWNHMTLALAGNTLTLTLNDQAIFERNLEPGDGRLFGFFRYADETESRVRAIRYQGQWPRTIPAGFVGAPPAR